jgi:hypothetical protein
MGMRAWATHAKTWRVGERLRPCKGCLRCCIQVPLYGAAVFGPWDGKSCPQPVCNGSWLLPARKARKVRG